MRQKNTPKFKANNAPLFYLDRHDAPYLHVTDFLLGSPFSKHGSTFAPACGALERLNNEINSENFKFPKTKFLFHPLIGCHLDMDALGQRAVCLPSAPTSVRYCY